MTRTVYIGAIAARTPVGLVAETSAAAVRAGIARINDHPTFVDRYGEPICGGLDPRLDSKLRGPERLVGLSEPALTELGAKIGLAPQAAGSLPLLLALPELRPGWTAQDTNVVAQRTAMSVTAGLAPLDVRVCGHGHAGAIHALGLAAQQVRAGAWELCIVGGVDSYFDGPTLSWLTKRRLLVGSSRAGLIPGEGAAFMLVGSRLGLQSLGLHTLATVRGWHSTMEVDRVMVDADSTAKALTEALLGATQTLDRARERVHDIYCDLNGERYRSEEWGFAMLRIPDRFVDGTRHTAATDSWGDMGAATGALSCVLAVRAWARSYANGPLALASAGSMSGLRSAVMLERAYP